MKILQRIPRSIALLFWMTLLVGVLYPLGVTALAQLLFPAKANGSLLVLGGQVRGSTLLAQKFESGRFFHPRPSATDYVYVGSGASNLAATNSALGKAVEARREAWLRDYGAQTAGAEPPAEMLYASASGLDPDISPEAARAQVDAIVAARGLDAAAKTRLLSRIDAAAAASISPIGPPRVNVVLLNAELETDPAFGGGN